MTRVTASEGAAGRLALHMYMGAIPRFWGTFVTKATKADMLAPRTYSYVYGPKSQILLGSAAGSTAADRSAVTYRFIQ